jgi:hypothetical protein
VEPEELETLIEADDARLVLVEGQTLRREPVRQLRLDLFGRHCQLGGSVRRYEHGLIGLAGYQDPFQAAVAVPVIWFQVVNRSVISWR